MGGGTRSAPFCVLMSQKRRHGQNLLASTVKSNVILYGQFYSVGFQFGTVNFDLFLKSLTQALTVLFFGKNDKMGD